MTIEPADHELEDHDRGLAFDMSTLLQRRRVLQLIGGAGLLALVGCASEAKSPSGSATSVANTAASSSAAGTTATTAAGASTSAGSAAATAVDAIPEETNGPYPADGSNGLNILTESGIVRSDIRSSFGSSTTTAEGIPTTVKLTIVEAGSTTPVAGSAVYIWHCDRAGSYSMYSDAAKDENYLRGVQEADANGQVTFQTIYPACYAGRWPHMHFEVYPSLDEATKAGTKLVTSQIALLEDTSNAVYATTGYEQSVRNMSQVSLTTDMVFSDGAELETPTVTGSVADGYVVNLTVGVES